MTRPVNRGTFRRSCRTCGWTGVYSTAAKADFSKRQHSCARWLRLAASHERGEARRAAVSHVERPCLHPVANHQHGTYAAYTLDGCRCPACKAAQSTYERNRVRQQAYGRWDNLVDAEPVRAHLANLKACGIGLKKVSELSGVSNGSLTKIWYGFYETTGTGQSAGCHGAGKLRRGPAKRVRKETAERLLAVEAIPANLGPGQDDHERTPLARKHLQSLVALGWSQAEVARRLGIHPSNFTQTIRGDQPMQRANVDKAEALFEQLSMTPPPESTHRERLVASRARNYARANGWVVPLALDDLAPVDEATEDELDEAVVLRLMDGDRTVVATHTERREAVRRLHAQQLLNREIAVLIGRTAKGVGDDLKALGLKGHPEHLGLSEQFTSRGRARRRQLQEAS